MKDLLTTLAYTKPKTVGGGETLEGTGAGTVTGIVNGFIGALGIIAVIVIIIGGIGYMTSAGDAGKVKKAKDTILYGIIGMIICVLAYAIVNFVISKL